MNRVTLYSRPDCHLCEQVEAELASLQKEFPHQLVVVDIENSPALQRQYGPDIPVVEIGPLTLKAPVSRSELIRALASASLAEAPVQGDALNLGAPNAAAGKRTYQTGTTWTRSDDITYWLSKHYLAILNLVVALYVGLPFLAPVLMRAGYERPAAIIYKFYSATCHQLAYRSFFLFGEQLVYPRQAAGLHELLTFQQATGIPEGNTTADIFAARNFVGNSMIGYKVALCERDIALYGSILLFGLIFALSGRRIRPLRWYWWLLFGILPIALDGLSQLFSQPPLNFIPYRESTPYLRVLTGFLFGFTTAWFGYPTIEQSMRDTQEMMEAKRLKTKAGPAAGQGKE